MNIAFAGSRCRFDRACDDDTAVLSYLASTFWAARVLYGIHAYADAGSLYVASGRRRLYAAPYSGGDDGLRESYGRGKRGRQAPHSHLPLPLGLRPLAVRGHRGTG